MQLFSCTSCTRRNFLVAPCCAQGNFQIAPGTPCATPELRPVQVSNYTGCSRCNFQITPSYVKSNLRVASVQRSRCTRCTSRSCSSRAPLYSPTIHAPPQHPISNQNSSLKLIFNLCKFGVTLSSGSTNIRKISVAMPVCTSPIRRHTGV